MFFQHLFCILSLTGLPLAAPFPSSIDSSLSNQIQINSSCSSDSDCYQNGKVCCLTPRSGSSFQCLYSSQCAIRYGEHHGKMNTKYYSAINYSPGSIQSGRSCSFSEECADSTHVCHKEKKNGTGVCTSYSKAFGCNEKAKGFVYRCGNQLYENGALFRWISMNVPNMLLLEDSNIGSTFRNVSVCRLPVQKPDLRFDKEGYAFGKENSADCIVPKPTDNVPRDSFTWITPTPAEQEDAVLAIKGLGGRVIRTYTLGFGATYHANIPSPTSAIEYYEPAWIAFDYAIAMAQKHGIRLIVPLINHYWGNLDYMGNFALLAGMRSVPYDQFYTSSVTRKDLKEILSFLLNRRNTITGIQYKNDPTILAWELGNELGGWSDQTPPSEWVLDIASFIKSLAPNTLVMDGTLGGNNAPARFAKQVLESDVVDIFSNHYYYNLEDPIDIRMIQSDTQFVAQKNAKVFIIGEIGFSYNIIDTVFKTMRENNGISSTMLWSLRFHSQRGGFYTHFEMDRVYSYHVPGFKQSPGFSADDYRMANLLRDNALALQGKSTASTPFPVPAPAQRAAGIIYSPYYLTWMGSSWAASFILQRSSESPFGPFKMIARNIVDGIREGQFTYNDSTAIEGVAYYYQVLPVSVDGTVNQGSPLLISV